MESESAAIVMYRMQAVIGKQANFGIDVIGDVVYVKEKE